MGTNSGANTVERQELRKNRAGNKCRGKCHQGWARGLSYGKRHMPCGKFSPKKFDIG